MAVSDLQIEHWDMGKGFHLDQSYPIFGKMFQPYEISRPSHWEWGDLYAEDQTTSFDLTNFQQGNEVFACTLLISNQGDTSVTFHMEIKFDQYRSGWQESSTASRDYGYITIQGKDDENTWANGSYQWAGVDPDEMRPGITQYRLRLLIDGDEWDTIYFSQSNLSFDTSAYPNGYLWVEGSNLCYVAPSYYSGSATTGYKTVVQYDTGYSGDTGQTPGMIRVPESSTDYHIYYVTSNGVVRRTKFSYPRPYSPSSTFTRKGSVWFTPSTQSSPEETGYHYLCYIDGGGHRRRLGPGEVD